MGTEVLRPHDCLIRPVISFRKPKPNPNPNPNPRSRKRREGSPRPKNQLVMGQVTLLKRGQSLDPKAKDVPTVSGSAVLDPDPLVLDPVQIPKQIQLETDRVVDVYAGSAFSTTSPSPKKVPLPSFSKRREMESFATRDLRRILRLD